MIVRTRALALTNACVRIWACMHTYTEYGKCHRRGGSGSEETVCRDAGFVQCLRPLSSHLSRKGRRGSSPTPLLDCMIGVTTLESPPTCVCAHECKHARKYACMCAGCCTCGGRPPSEPFVVPDSYIDFTASGIGTGVYVSCVCQGPNGPPSSIRFYAAQLLTRHPPLLASSPIAHAPPAQHKTAHQTGQAQDNPR